MSNPPGPEGIKADARAKPHIVRAALYFSMFPISIVGAAVFYVALRLRVLGMSQGRREPIARFFIHQGARLLFHFLRVFSLVEVSFDHGKGRAGEGPSIVIANHPSMLDAMLLLCEFPNAVCIMKRSLLRIPIVSGFATMAGYLGQNETDELFRAGREALSQGASIIIFPEGTRSPIGELGTFHRGAARLALETGAPVTLFALSMDPVVLGRGPAWTRPPGSIVRYKAVRIERGKHEMDGVGGEVAEGVREESVRLTRHLEDRVKNSLF